SCFWMPARIRQFLVRRLHGTSSKLRVDGQTRSTTANGLIAFLREWTTNTRKFQMRGDRIVLRPHAAVPSLSIVLPGASSSSTQSQVGNGSSRHFSRRLAG